MGECGAPNGALVLRDRDQKEHWSIPCSHELSLMHAGDMESLDGYPVKIVLTVAHLDHDPANNDDSNLLAMCQLCHLRYDKALHAQNASTTRREKKAVGDLFGNEQSKPTTKPHEVAIKLAQ